MSKQITSLAYSGNFNGVKSLLNTQANIHAVRNSIERGPLHYAAAWGHLAIVRLLLDRGANINSRDKHKSTPFIAAAEHGHISIVRELLDRGANINARDSSGFTALMRAARGGHVEVVKLLLERGANNTGLANIKITYSPPKYPQYTTSTKNKSVLKNTTARVQRRSVPENISKPEKLKHYLTNVNPNKIKLNISNKFNNNLNQNVKVFKLRYIINGRNAGNAVAVVPLRNGPVHFGEGATHKDFRGRGVGTLLRAILTKAVLKAGYNRIQHQGENREKRSITRPGGNKGVATSTWILRTRLGFKKVPDENANYNSEFTKNNNQGKINSILRNAGMNL